MKKCNKCLILKNYSEFFKNKKNKDGLYTSCKECHKNYTKHYFSKNPDKWIKRREWLFEKHRKDRGIPIDRPRKGHHSVHGHLNKQGYRILIGKKYLGHPCCNDKKGRMFEHRYVMYNYLRRPLKPKECIHHKNGIRHDNRIENLELCTKIHPPGRRVEDVISWCIEFLKEYGYDVNKING